MICTIVAASALFPPKYTMSDFSCFKCGGSGLKPCKKSQAKFLLKCTVCHGLGFHELKKVSPIHKPFRPFKSPSQQGPNPIYDISSEFQKVLSTIKEDEMLSGLSGKWMIYQLESGHRITTDDCCISSLVVSCYLDLKWDLPKRYLDLGTGLSSVLHMVSWGLRLEGSSVVGVEAQTRHVELARRTTHFNDFHATILLGDLRDLTYSQVPKSCKYDLITGTPPYFPVSAGSLPNSRNRAECAFEFRGDVSAYMSVSRQFLMKSGRLFIANGGTVERTLRAGREHSFQCTHRWEICGRIGKDVLFSVYLFVFENSCDEFEDLVLEQIYVRDEQGQFTSRYLDLVELIGKPRGKFEPASVPHIIEKKDC